MKMCLTSMNETEIFPHLKVLLSLKKYSEWHRRIIMCLEEETHKSNICTHPFQCRYILSFLLTLSGITLEDYICRLYLCYSWIKVRAWPENTGPRASLLLNSSLVFVRFCLCHLGTVWERAWSRTVHHSLCGQDHPTLKEEQRLPSRPEKRCPGPFYVLVHLTLVTTGNHAG